MKTFKAALRRLVDQQWLVTLGHYGWPAPLIVAVAMRWMPSLSAAYSLLPLLLVALVPLMVHAAGICPRCAPGMVPTCPTEQVERHRKVLEWVHRPLSQPVTWVLVGVHLALTAAGWWSTTCTRWTTATLIVVFAGELWAVRQHAQLRPWCPLCRGKGRDDEAAQAPDGPGGRALDPTPPTAPADDLTVEALQAHWRGRPAPAEPTAPRPDSPIRSSGDAPTPGGAR